MNLMIPASLKHVNSSAKSDLHFGESFKVVTRTADLLRISKDLNI